MSRTGPITKDVSSIALGLAQIRVGPSASNIANVSPVLTAEQSIGALANTKYAGNADFWKLESGFPLQEDLTIPLRETHMLECAFKEISPANLALARGIDPQAAVDATVTEGTVISAGDGDTSGAGALTIGATETDTTTESWTAVFSTSSAFDVFGSISGHVGAGTVSGGFTPATAHFVIAADFFANTWAAEDTYTFTTTAYAAAGAGAFANSHEGIISLGTLASPAFVRMEAVFTFPDPQYSMTIIFPRANVVSSVDLDLQAEDSAAVTISFESKGASDDNDDGNAVWNDSSLGRIVFA